jgi:hypothetical protein
MIKNNYTDVQAWTVNDIVDALGDTPNKKQKIIIPKYQRNIVWDTDQKKLFIFSVQAGYPIGSLLLFKTGTDNVNTIYSLTDGLQRASTLLHYSKNPTEYFDTDKVPDTLVNEILDLIKPTNLLKDEVKNTISNWIKGLKGFEGRNSFSSRELADEIDDKLNLKLSKDKNKRLGKVLQPFTDEVREKADIFDFKIPIVIYTGDESNLPTIFERLNKQGTQLTKYQIYAATWANHKIKIKNKNIIEAIAAKYQNLIDKGLEIDTFSKEYFSVFEYFFGLSKILVTKYPTMFGKEQAEGVGFSLGSVCLDIGIKTMNGKHENLPSKFLEMDKAAGQSAFEKALFDSIETVDSYLNPFISLKANKKRTTQTAKSTIYHTEFQIISMIGKVFKSKYQSDLKTIKSDWKQVNKNLRENLPYHYLHDLLRGLWRNSGDSKSLLMSNRVKYERPLARSTWNIALDEWFKSESEKQEKNRANISDLSVLFMKYIYTHLFTAHEELSVKEIEIEHIIPVDRLKPLVGTKGIAISAISNLCFIDKKLNRSKGSSTFYEYADEKKGTPNAIKLSEVEKYTFIKRKDIAFSYEQAVELDDYESFLENRFSLMKEQFFVLNSINGTDTDSFSMNDSI